MIGGRYDGARYIDGVVVNDYLRPIAYLVAVGTDQKHSADVMAVPAEDILLAYVPEYPDQVRGYSQLRRINF
jgi:capsid protein